MRGKVAKRLRRISKREDGTVDKKVYKRLKKIHKAAPGGLVVPFE